VALPGFLLVTNIIALTVLFDFIKIKAIPHKDRLTALRTIFVCGIALKT